MAPPAPISVPASGNFRGDDGSWSTFKIKAGNPAQDVEVLVSTITPETWVISNLGCNKNSPENCSNSRGGLFDIQNSTTWQDQQIYVLTSEASLGLNTNSDAGDYGFDALSIPSSNGDVTLDSQVLATIATPDFWLGNLGISPRQVNYDGTPHPSFITNLNSTNKIPSLSYGYTAGASYQSNTTASLTFGGYDQSRFIPNDNFFTFAPSNSGRDLLVGIQAITFSDSTVGSSPLLPTTLFALVDSTVPDIWLPLDACTAFEKAFQITWDPIHLKYIVNDTVHDSLLKQNASVKFQLGNAVDSGPTIDIVLPYASFDLQAGPPLLPNVTRYFPLRQAQDSSQYTLGRTFLQEAYLTADYERGNFSISQCTWPVPKNPDIITINHKSTGSGTAATTSTTATPTSTVTSTAKPSPTAITITQSHSLGTSAIAGIAIAVLIIAILSASTALYVLWWRPRHPKRGSSSTSSCCGSRKNKNDGRDMPPELAGAATNFYDPKRGSYFDPIPGAGAGHKANKPSQTISEVEGNFGLPSMSPQIIHNPPVELGSDDIRVEMASPDEPKRKSTAWTNHLEMPSPNPSSIGSGPSPPDQECPEDRLSQVFNNNSDAGRTMYPIPSPETEQGSFAGSIRGARPPTPSAFQSPQITHTRFGSNGSDVGSMTSVLHSPVALELDSSRLDFPSPQPSPRPDEPLMGGK